MIRLLICLAVLTTPALAQLKWEKPWQEFHRSPEDGHVETAFAFKNTGSTTITIKGIKASCGCTSTRLEKKIYAPGEGGEVTAKFTFGDRRGAQRKQIVVTTDDELKQTLDLVVFIEQALTITPALLFWKVGQPAEPKVVELAGATGKTVRVKKVTSPNPRFTAVLETVKAGAHYRIAVQPADTTQKEAVELTVETDYPPDSPRSYTIHARVK